MADVFAQAKIASAQKWSASNQGPAHRARHRREQPVPDARRGGPRRRPVRPAAVPDRHALRPVHRPRPRCAQLRLLPGRALPARRHAERHHARARRRRPPVDQPAADRARPAGPAPLRAGLRRRAGGDDGGGLPADRRPGRRIAPTSASPPARSARSSAPTTSWKAGALAGGYWLREPGAERRSGDRRHGRGHARGARRVGGTVAPTSPASACSPSPRPTCSTAAGPRRRPARWQGDRAPSHVETPACPGSRPAPASSPSPTPRRPRCPGSAACSASASRRWASTASARPATSPTSTPPTASTAPRSPKRLPSCCSPPRGLPHARTLFRRMAGRRPVAHAVTRTVTETDNVLISTLTHNPQPLHLDRGGQAANSASRWSIRSSPSG